MEVFSLQVRKAQSRRHRRVTVPAEVACPAEEQSQGFFYCGGLVQALHQRGSSRLLPSFRNPERVSESLQPQCASSQEGFQGGPMQSHAYWKSAALTG